MKNRLLLLLTLALVASVQAQQNAGTIVFIHAPDGGPPWPVEDVYAMDADGTNVRAMTNDGHSHHPVWSPDGKRVLFVHDSSLETQPASREQKQYESHHPVELYVMDRDGGNRRLLRRLEPVIHSVAWSPDGKTLAISGIRQTSANGSQPAERHAGLFLLPADAQGEPRFLFPDAWTPSWSPDGRKLAFSVERPRGQWAIHVANADGSDDLELTDPPLTAGSPAWSPDGKLIAFDRFVGGSNQQIFVMGVDGSRQRQVTADLRWSCEHPSWSPDGKELVFACRSALNPCGVVSSVGTLLPECSRRIFSVSPFDQNAKPVRLNERDGAAPEFAPVR
jgi:Tol biopolymer transport system component